MNKKNMEVLINVIGAVESGGQVYGQRRYDAYAAPYTNSDNEHTITLGWAQNYGANAQTLIRMIRDADPEGFKKMDSATGLISKALEKDWVRTKYKPSATQKTILINMITSEVGKKCQDDLFAEQMEVIIKECEDTYSKDPKVVMMYCEIRHLGGLSAVQRIFNRISGPITLDKIMASLVQDQKDTSSNNQVGDSIYWSRHLKCKEFIEQYAVDEAPATGSEKTRTKIVELANSWLGKKESDGSFKSIIDIYNSYKPHPRGYTVQYSDAWCAATVSALAIKLGYTDIIPVECSCWHMMELAREKGIWVEDDAFVPQPGDIIMYDWQDSGYGDNQGVPDHVGIVVAVSGSTITIVEGNRNDSVATRSLQVNGQNIRGYICPRYDAEPVQDPDPTRIDHPTSKQTFAVSGTGDPNEDPVFVGVVNVGKLNVRTWAGTSYPNIKSYPRLKLGDKVLVCDSILASKGAKWYYVRIMDKWTGFVCAQYITKL